MSSLTSDDLNLNLWLVLGGHGVSMCRHSSGIEFIIPANPSVLADFEHNYPDAASRALSWKLLIYVSHFSFSPCDPQAYK